jgi:hypothetical protein
MLYTNTVQPNTTLIIHIKHPCSVCHCRTRTVSMSRSSDLRYSSWLLVLYMAIYAIVPLSFPFLDPLIVYIDLSAPACTAAGDRSWHFDSTLFELQIFLNSSKSALRCASAADISSSKHRILYNDRWFILSLRFHDVQLLRFVGFSSLVAVAATRKRRCWVIAHDFIFFSFHRNITYTEFP